MVPKHLTLKNFLSYREASLDFSGLHVACIAGPNGAGKSSLLEAIGWALWGESRVAAEDDVIHQGELEAQVVLSFQQGEQVYRILRSRHRIQGTGLEFQVKTESGYRVLTQRGVRATQRLIDHHLKLDYDTFIHSAYLRQGRADEFMAKRPSDRKQILADLLRLHRYDQLSEQAREQARQAKAEVTLRTAQLEELTTALASYDAVLSQQAELQADLQQLDQALEQAQQQRLEWQQRGQAYHRQQQQLPLYQQQHHHQVALHRQTEADLADTIAQLAQGEQVLAEAAAIEAGIQTWQALEAEDADLNQRFQRYQHLQERRQSLEADYRARSDTLQH
ncbi:MAG TPA: SMC family ATPase, partial [Leptolyngbyaceae cyanobacterium M65_K2018_010]|nr:SMC family ATPase [Leptolyngbyaceae cyanobacterium M65_K2018_010]